MNVHSPLNLWAVHTHLWQKHTFKSALCHHFPVLPDFPAGNLFLKLQFKGCLWRMGYTSESTTSLLATPSKGIALSSEQPYSELVLLFQGALCLVAVKTFAGIELGFIRTTVLLWECSECWQVEEESEHPRDLAFSKLHKNLHLRLTAAPFNLYIDTEIFTYGPTAENITFPQIFPKPGNHMS